MPVPATPAVGERYLTSVRAHRLPAVRARSLLEHATAFPSSSDRIASSRREGISMVISPFWRRRALSCLLLDLPIADGFEQAPFLTNF